MDVLRDFYDELFVRAADPRTMNWPLVSEPFTVTVILLAYLYAVYVWSPRHMKDRPAYDLRTVIWYYNIFQIVVNIWLSSGIYTSGWHDRFSLGCVPIAYTTDPMSMRLASFLWWALCLKIFDLVETIFFVFRKKQNQVSFLHVYHHVTTVLLAWLGVKYVAGAMASFPFMVNTGVHAFMYTYYLLASMGPTMQRRISPFKRYLTIIQMVQFCVVILHAAQSLAPSCRVSRIIAYIYMPNVAVIFYLFYDFYKAAYKPSNKNK